MRWVLLIVACCLPVSASASAIERGAVEILANGGFTHQNFSDVDGSVSTLRAQAAFLKAASDVVQIGGRLGIEHQSIDLRGYRETDGGSLQADGLIRVNLGSSTTVIPFLQGGVGVIVWSTEFGGDEETFLLPHLALGLRMMVHDIASLNITAGWTREVNALGAEDFDANDFEVLFGFSVFPRGVDGSR